MAGWEGVFGLILTMMLLVPAQFLVCPFDDLQCKENSHTNDIFLASRQASTSPVIVLQCLAFMMASAFFNGFAATVTKYASAASQMIIDSTRVIFIAILACVWALCTAATPASL